MSMLPENTVRASARAATLVIVFVVAITIAAEMSAPLKTALASMTGHHWVTKSVASVLIYMLLFAFFARSATPVRADQAARSVHLLVATSFAGAAALTGYFLWHFLAL
ncbi:MAG: hypothetical protein WC866_03795 [Patescibacteria group bacterium]